MPQYADRKSEPRYVAADTLCQKALSAAFKGNIDVARQHLNDARAEMDRMAHEQRTARRTPNQPNDRTYSGSISGRVY